MLMYISVIVCTYNRDKILRKCVDGILKNSYSKERYEIIIIDNNSSDNTRLICEEIIYKYKNVRYAFEGQTGLSAARNKGIKEAKGDILVFIDDDAFMNENYLQEVQSFFDENKNVVFAGGKINPIWNVEKPKWFTDDFASIIGETLYGDIDRKLNYPESPLGGNMIFRSSIFDIIGGFNVDLGIKGEKLYLGEENEICRKIVNLGYDVYYISNAIVDHIVHENKVNQRYIMERIKLEGECYGSYEGNEVNILKRFILLGKRIGILVVRDIPLYIINLFNEKKVFSKKCKINRSIQYIKALFFTLKK